MPARGVAAARRKPDEAAVLLTRAVEAEALDVGDAAAERPDLQAGKRTESAEEAVEVADADETVDPDAADLEADAVGGRLVAQRDLVEPVGALAGRGALAQGPRPDVLAAAPSEGEARAAALRSRRRPGRAGPCAARSRARSPSGPRTGSSRRTPSRARGPRGRSASPPGSARGRARARPRLVPLPPRLRSRSRRARAGRPRRGPPCRPRGRGASPTRSCTTPRLGHVCNLELGDRRLAGGDPQAVALPQAGRAAGVEVDVGGRAVLDRELAAARRCRRCRGRRRCRRWCAALGEVSAPAPASARLRRGLGGVPARVSAPVPAWIPAWVPGGGAGVGVGVGVGAGVGAGAGLSAGDGVGAGAVKPPERRRQWDDHVASRSGVSRDRAALGHRSATETTSSSATVASPAPPAKPIARAQPWALTAIYCDRRQAREVTMNLFSAGFATPRRGRGGRRAMARRV